MPYNIVVNRLHALSPSDKMDLQRELDLLRAELNDLRTKYTALQAGITAGSAIGAANYPNASVQLAAARFTPT